MKLTEKKKQNYIDMDGNICPYCESSDIERGERNTGCGVHTQATSCNECGKKWTDVYKLVSVV